jgi:hypothetical protein
MVYANALRTFAKVREQNVKSSSVGDLRKEKTIESEIHLESRKPK